MQSNYLVWARKIIDGACTLSPMTGYPEDWKLLAGIPVAGEFPKASQFAMNPDNPTAITLTDSLYNIDMLLVASAKLRELLEAQAVPELEFLPVAVMNHKNRAVSEPYAIVNLLKPVDCLDLEACQPRWGRIDKEDINKLKQLVIDESRIDPSRLLFRAKHFKREMIVHRKLAQAIDAAGCTGQRWIELADYRQ